AALAIAAKEVPAVAQRLAPCFARSEARRHAQAYLWATRPGPGPSGAAGGSQGFPLAPQDSRGPGQPPTSPATKSARARPNSAPPDTAPVLQHSGGAWAGAAAVAARADPSPPVGVTHQGEDRPGKRLLVALDGVVVGGALALSPAAGQVIPLAIQAVRGV